jgi:hypothetical protein
MLVGPVSSDAGPSSRRISGLHLHGHFHFKCTARAEAVHFGRPVFRGMMATIIPSCKVLTIPSIGDWERFSSEVRQRDRGLFRVDLASANGDVQAAAYPFRTQFKL